MTFDPKRDSQVFEFIEKAISWRQAQSELTSLSTLRLFSGISDGIQSLWIDQYDHLIVATIYKMNHQLELIQSLVDFFKDRPLLIKAKSSHGFKRYLYHCDEHPIVCRENNCFFEIRKDLEHDFGLFIDTRAAREWVQSNSINMHILNLFSYSCAFAVYGKKALAAQITNIDPNSDYLNWGKRNAELNQVDFRNFKDTAQKYLPRHLRRLATGKDSPYDLVIADPPAFLIGRGNERLGRKVWPLLLQYFMQSQAKYLLLICNDRSFREERNLQTYFSDELKGFYQLQPLNIPKDISGKNPNLLYKKKDYSPPDIFIAERK